MRNTERHSRTDPADVLLYECPVLRLYIVFVR